VGFGAVAQRVVRSSAENTRFYSTVAAYLQAVLQAPASTIAKTLPQSTARTRCFLRVLQALALVLSPNAAGIVATNRVNLSGGC
jgi:Tfp pilus assembly protein PilN